MATHRWREEGQEGERESRWVSGKSTEGENIEQADVLLGLVRDSWSKGGACDKIQDGGSKHVNL